MWRAHLARSETSESSQPAIRTTAPRTDSRQPMATVARAVLLGLALVAVALRGGSYEAVERTEAYVLVWWVLAFGVAFGLLPRRRATPALGLSLAALLGLALWTALALAWTPSAERTV